MLLSVPNYSEGRDPARIAGLRAALAGRLRVLDRHSDRQHHRTVFTVAGEPDQLTRALPDSADLAAKSIDMWRHRGLHPCIGALDVCPLVWLRPEERRQAQDVAYAIADEIGGLGIPVFFYGEMATTDERQERAYFRNGGIEALERRMTAGELMSDRGPNQPHSRAGATLITARPPIAAFNIELDTDKVEVATEIAAELRESGGGLPGVRAIGLPREGTRVQVSTNVHDPVSVPLVEVVERVRQLAASHQTKPLEAEIVGLVPAAALIGYPADVPIRDRDDARQTIEGRLG